VIVYYFSGTGNSLKAARDIAEKCGGSIASMRMPAAPTESGGAVGFVFPVYYGGLPNAVRQFIRQSDFTGLYFFAVATYGAMSGGAINDVDALIRDKGLRLDYGAGVRAYPNYIAAYPMFRNAQRTAAKQDKKIAGIAGEISRETRNINKKPDFTRKTDAANILASKDCCFTVSDDCVNCGMCAKICPVGNIELAYGKPAFRHGCEQCMACIQWCPQRAINYGNKTQKRRRYHHPAVKAEDLFV
jgi:ferredoxin